MQRWSRSRSRTSSVASRRTITPSEEALYILSLALTAHDKGYTRVLLLGMGGSSLAPEVFRKTFGAEDGYLDLAVLDSTDPGAVQAHAERLDPARTLFIVATKSGGTAETLSLPTSPRPPRRIQPSGRCVPGCGIRRASP